MRMPLYAHDGVTRTLGHYLLLLGLKCALASVFFMCRRGGGNVLSEISVMLRLCACVLYVSMDLFWRSLCRVVARRLRLARGHLLAVRCGRAFARLGLWGPGRPFPGLMALCCVALVLPRPLRVLGLVSRSVHCGGARVRVPCSRPVLTNLWY